MAKLKVDKFTYYDLIIYAARGSTGARRLSTVLGSRRWRDDLPERYTRRRPYFRGNSSPVVINWGSTVHPRWLEDPRFRLTPRIANHGDIVKTAINKLEFFKAAAKIEGSIPLIKWTESRDKALEWIGKGKPVIARTNLTGSSGAGIVFGDTAERLVEAPLYTRYYPKTHEFRVHVFDGKVIDLTEKKFKGGKDARANAGDRTIVRSHTNGWVHCHDKISLQELAVQSIGKECCNLVNGLGLQFGAVDVMAILDVAEGDNPRKLKNFVLCEVNTGPGLENTSTIEAYKKAILDYYNNGKYVSMG